MLLLWSVSHTEPMQLVVPEWPCGWKGQRLAVVPSCLTQTGPLRDLLHLLADFLWPQPLSAVVIINGQPQAVKFLPVGVQHQLCEPREGLGLREKTHIHTTQLNSEALLTEKDTGNTRRLEAQIPLLLKLLTYHLYHLYIALMHFLSLHDYCNIWSEASN